MSLSATSARSSTRLQQSITFTCNCPPLDILRRICSFLDNPKDVVHFGLANRYLRVLLTDTELWNSLLYKHFPDSYANLKSQTEGLALYKHLIKIVYHMNAGEYRIQTLWGHRGWINCMTLWDDKLVSGSKDAMIKIWDLNTGQKLRTLKGHQGWVNCTIIWDNKLISGSDDRTIKFGI